MWSLYSSKKVVKNFFVQVILYHARQFTLGSASMNHGKVKGQITICQKENERNVYRYHVVNRSNQGGM